MDLKLYADIKPPFELKLELENSQECRTPSVTPPLVCLVHVCVLVREQTADRISPYRRAKNSMVFIMQQGEAHLILSCTKSALSAFQTNLMFYRMNPSAYQFTLACNSRSNIK